MILFIETIHTTQVQRQSADWWLPGAEGKRKTGNDCFTGGGFLWGDKDALKLDRGGYCTTL